jgi:hypothetical protein
MLSCINTACLTVNSQRTLSPEQQTMCSISFREELHYLDCPISIPGTNNLLFRTEMPSEAPYKCVSALQYEVEQDCGKAEKILGV